MLSIDSTEAKEFQTKIKMTCVHVTYMHATQPLILNKFTGA